MKNLLFTINASAVLFGISFHLFANELENEYVEIISDPRIVVVDGEIIRDEKFEFEVPFFISERMEKKSFKGYLLQLRSVIKPLAKSMETDARLSEAGVRNMCIIPVFYDADISDFAEKALERKYFALSYNPVLNGYEICIHSIVGKEDFDLHVDRWNRNRTTLLDSHKPTPAQKKDR